MYCCRYSVFLIVSVTLIAKTENVTIGSLLASYSDVQGLLDAYNKKDYVQVGIKAIDLKMKLDPPEKNSTAEKRLMRLKDFLKRLHPYYLKTKELKLNVNQMFNNVKTKLDNPLASSAKKLIHILDTIETNIDSSIETLKSHLSRFTGNSTVEETTNEEEYATTALILLLTKTSTKYVTESTIKQFTVTERKKKQTGSSTKQPPQYSSTTKSNHKEVSSTKVDIKSENKTITTAKPTTKASSGTKAGCTTKKPNGITSTQKQN